MSVATRKELLKHIKRPAGRRGVKFLMNFAH